MKIEHVAWQAQDPVKVAGWYVEHLGFQVKRGFNEPPYAHFLADSTGQVMIEIYNNPKASVPDYSKQHPLLLHLAFVSEDVAADRARLIAAGAKPEGEIDKLPDGDELCMLRDPWGFPIQLAKRGKRMV